MAVNGTLVLMYKRLGAIQRTLNAEEQQLLDTLTAQGGEGSYEARVTMIKAIIDEVSSLLEKDSLSRELREKASELLADAESLTESLHQDMARLLNAP